MAGQTQITGENSAGGSLTQKVIDVINTNFTDAVSKSATVLQTIVSAITITGALIASAGLAVTGAITAATLTLTGILKGSGLTYATVAITASGAIDPHTSACYVITKSSAAAAMTLAAPTATTDDGVTIEIYALGATPRAHTITATGLFVDGSTTTDVATFAANNGAGVRLMAYNAKWIVLVQSVGVTMS